MGGRQLLGGMASVLALALGCSPQGSTWPRADALFHQELRWIGGDGAVSVDLKDGRTLWLFGDSYIAQSRGLVRAQSTMVRNSVAIQTGANPSRAFMRFSWRGEGSGASSFFPEEGSRWYWPGHGLRMGNQLLLFYGRLYQASEGMWGFASDGYTAVIVPNADLDADQWTFNAVRLPGNSHGVDLGGAVLEEDNHVYVYGHKGDRHSLHVARFNRDAVLDGDLSHPQWWCGGLKRWCAEGPPRAVVTNGAPEYSIHKQNGRYLMVFTLGFGATQLAVRQAPQPQGPWSPPSVVFDPPESHEPDAFVYAGKAHPQLDGAELVATYVPSSFAARPVEDEKRLYFPHFARLVLPP